MKTSSLYYIVAAIWMITALINAAVSILYYMSGDPLGTVYICIASTCICLSMLFLQIGFKKRNGQEEDKKDKE